jgi:hypothetical protein
VVKINTQTPAQRGSARMRRGLETVHDGHPDVHQDDIGLGLDDEVDGVRSVGGAVDDVEVGGRTAGLVELRHVELNAGRAELLEQPIQEPVSRDVGPPTGGLVLVDEPRGELGGRMLQVKLLHLRMRLLHCSPDGRQRSKIHRLGPAAKSTE